jgi:hypothetical protein
MEILRKTQGSLKTCKMSIKGENIEIIEDDVKATVLGAA